MFETGYFAALWRNVALKLGLEVDFVPGDWRHGVDSAVVEGEAGRGPGPEDKGGGDRPQRDLDGGTSRVHDVRKAIDRANHPALLMVDTISSLASIDYRHDEWGIDVTVCCSQKGLMLPPGFGLNAVSDKALEASKSARLPRSYWDWQAMIRDNTVGFFPYTPATNLLYGLREALRMLFEEGLDRVFARHLRHAEATRRAVRAWGLEILCLEPGRIQPRADHRGDPGRPRCGCAPEVVLERFDMSLGTGLGKLKGRVFRIGHLGDFNDLMLAGTLCGVEMGLSLADVPIRERAG